MDKSHPDNAAQRARETGPLHYIAAVPMGDFPKNGDPAEVGTAFFKKSDARVADAEQARVKRSAYYDTLVAKNLPSAGIYMKILEFNADLSQEHKDTQAYPENWTKSNLASRDYLQQAIDRAKHASG